MIDKVGINRIQQRLIVPSTPKQVNDDKAGVQADATLSVESASLVERAMQADRIDRAVIEQAKSMLLSGELDSTESILGAADNLLQFGL